MPPFSPPHVMIGMVPLEKLRKGLSNSTGTATAVSRAKSAKSTAIAPPKTDDMSKATAKTSNPIIKNRMALRISSIIFQNAST